MAAVEIRQLELGPMANYVYLAADPETKECAVVDPAWDVPAVFRAAEAEGWRITQAYLTHNHPDHTNGVVALLSQVDVPIYIHSEDAFALPEVEENLKKVSGGETVALGKLETTFLHTPGHTRGSQCFLFQDTLLTGDTLFVDTCGRVDLPGSDPEAMYRSLRKLSALGAEMKVLPGHNYSEEPSITIGEARTRNRFLAASLRLSAAEFASLTGAY